ncbi:Gfo/Idh/MocA family oxidoreductase [uncultured Bacteroides sp.]|uniref:Gfo/Idh/MocA family oxidoreductase n=1 Tax=uncultured Bacteroides sp. TaxID=162156 RepID=UPI00259A0F88|nr:Gfo/Idh/MocA family oxidoreductase [uncultured Bacteroides sp.]
MDRIRTGLAAYGMSGRVFHAPFISVSPHFELTAITERSKELSRGKYPDACIVRSFDALIGLEGLDLVVINTPDGTHYEYARRALEAGKHVIVEKPFTTTVAEAEELVALAASRGLTLSVYQNRRWDGDFLTVSQILSEGLLGHLVEFESTFPRYRNFVRPDTWKETGKDGGGLTYNLGAHVIDQAVQLFGMPEAIFADIATLRKDGKVDDYFIIHLLRPSKAPEVRITLKSSYLMCANEPRFVLHGREGSYVKYGLDPQEAALTEGLLPGTPHWGEEDKSFWGLLHTERDGKVVREPYPSLPGDYAAFYDNIYQHIRCGKPLQSDAREVVGVIRLIEAAWESSRMRRVVRI